MTSEAHVDVSHEDIVVPCSGCFLFQTSGIFSGAWLSKGDRSVGKEKVIGPLGQAHLLSHASIPSCANVRSSTSRVVLMGMHSVGAKVYFHNNSGLIIDNKATLKVNGTLSEKVIFEGDRLENGFSKVPGQWGTIWMRAGSIDNQISHAQIKNGIIGILIDSIGKTNSPNNCSSASN